MSCEIEVLKLVGKGKNNHDAQILYLSKGTVKNYLTHILSQLEMRDRIQVAWVQQNLQCDVEKSSNYTLEDLVRFVYARYSQTKLND